MEWSGTFSILAAVLRLTCCFMIDQLFLRLNMRLARSYASLPEQQLQGWSEQVHCHEHSGQIWGFASGNEGITADRRNASRCASYCRLCSFPNNPFSSCSWSSPNNSCSVFIFVLSLVVNNSHYAYLRNVIGQCYGRANNHHQYQSQISRKNLLLYLHQTLWSDCSAYSLDKSLNHLY